MTTPLSPPTVKGTGRKELPAYLSNGLIGLRVRDNPLAAGMTLLCGYSGLHPERKIEAAAVVPYPLSADVALNGIWLSDVPHLVEVVDQAYDFSNGELTTRLRFTVQGVTAEIEVLTFCCRHQPTLVAQEIEIRMTAACDFRLRSLVDARQIQGSLAARTRDLPGGEKSTVDGSLLWESSGAFAQCGIAISTELIGE
jgi:trehalose/maltose hydrolase-like predicted phosphorylase